MEIDRVRTSGRRRLSRGLAATLMLAAGLGFTVAVAHPAAAYCSGSGRPEPIYEVWGFESARGGDASTTCDNDNIYRGNVYDTLTDGSCVTAQYFDAGRYFNQATSCNSAGLAYTFYDQNGDRSSYVRICRNQGCGSWYFSYNY
jgi:hypothetical protein